VPDAPRRLSHVERAPHWSPTGPPRPTHTTRGGVGGCDVVIPALIPGTGHPAAATGRAMDPLVPARRSGRQHPKRCPSPSPARSTSQSTPSSPTPPAPATHHDGAELGLELVEDGPQPGFAAGQGLVEDLLPGRGESVAVMIASADVRPRKSPVSPSRSPCPVYVDAVLLPGHLYDWAAGPGTHICRVVVGPRLPHARTTSPNNRPQSQTGSTWR
jgi:hypothetical protein